MQSDGGAARLAQPGAELIMVLGRVACITACPKDATFTCPSLEGNIVFSISTSESGKNDIASSTDDNSEQFA